MVIEMIRTASAEVHVYTQTLGVSRGFFFGN